MRENKRYHEAENHTGQDNSHTLVIEGRNAVLEAFRSGKPIDKVFVLDGCQDGPVRTIVREAKKHDALLNFVTKERLSQISETGKHQGVVAYAAAYEYSTVDDMLALAEERGEDPFILILDNIEDPHNLRYYQNGESCRSTWSDHSKKTGSRADGNCCKDFGRGIELYSGCQSDESG